MKPSPYLPAAPLTYADLDIWECLMERFGAGMRSRSHEEDGVDARRMLAIELTRVTPLNDMRPKNYPAWPMVMTLMRANHRWCGLWDLTSEPS
jgi:hypothetical protein